MKWNRKARLFYRLHAIVNWWARVFSPFDVTAPWPHVDKLHPLWRLNNRLAKAWLDERDRLNPQDGKPHA